MATASKNLSTYDENNIPNANSYKFGIAVSDWNKQITHALYEGCFEALRKHGCPTENIKTLQVPGAFELPMGARLLLSNDKYDAVICLGCVIKGETKHNEYINNAVSQGLVNIGLTSGTPCIYGVLTPDNEAQALDRAGGKHGNKGVEAAITAIRMADLKKKCSGAKQKIGF